jgi:prepilin-type N-terminal cleavage/methylation domain-containing protein
MQQRRQRRPGTAAAFTMIELMVVVAIMAIFLTISVPFMNTAIGKRKGINGAVKDVQEALKLARDWAILKQTPHEVRIRPGDGVFDVGPLSGESSEQPAGFSPDVSGHEWRSDEGAGQRPGAAAAGSFSVTLPAGVRIEGLGVNGEDWTEDPVAHVRFYPNGTSDEMSVVLYRAESGERRNVWLEVVTGLSEIETDPAKFKVR